MNMNATYNAEIKMRGSNLTAVLSESRENNFIDLSKSDQKKFEEVSNYFTRLQEIHLLSKILKFNIDALVTKYTLHSSGEVFQGTRAASEYSDFISVNALVTNLISAGHSLYESMGDLLKKSNVNHIGASDEFRQMCSEVYDRSFSFRLLFHMRHYAQHGHIPVSQFENWFGFIPSSILNETHFNLNRKLKDEIMGLSKIAKEKMNDNGRICLTLTVAEYTYQLFRLYVDFLNFIRPDLFDGFRECEEIIHNYPENIFSSHEADGFCFKVVDSTAHFVPSIDWQRNNYDEILAEANTLQQYYEKEWRNLEEGTTFILLEDNDRKTL